MYDRLWERKFELQFYIDEEIENIKNKVEEMISKWDEVAIVCMTGDLAHPWHIAYTKSIKHKLWNNVKVIVWLEDWQRTQIRKWKTPILSNEERKYQWKHIKGIEDIFIRNSGRLYPSDLMTYIQPTYWVTHEEYFDNLPSYLRTARKIRKMWANTKMVVITNKDIAKLPEGDIRNKWNLSSSNIVKRIVANQKENILSILSDEL